MERVLDLRTQSLTVVLEDVFQPHNASAAVRSCECFGIQDVHIVEGKFPYRLNKDVVLGASKWIELHRYGGPGVDHTRVCLDRIKGEGFAIAATTLSNDAVPIDQLNVSQNLALCFGSEEDGLSDTAMNLADLLVKIPMFGFNPESQPLRQRRSLPLPNHPENSAHSYRLASHPGPTPSYPSLLAQKIHPQRPPHRKTIPGKAGFRNIPTDEWLKVLEEGGKLPVAEALRCRVR